MLKLVGTILQNQGGDDEKVVRVIHRHWFNVFQQFFVVVVLVVAMFGSFLLLPRIAPGFAEDEELQKLFSFIENTVTLFMWIYIFFVWVEYYFDVFIITDRKIVNIAQKGLFIRAVSELKFERIQDVAVEVRGLIPTVLNYGNLYIQTAGEQERFVFEAMPDPYEVKNMIMNLQKEQIREETNELGEIVRQEIHKELA